MHIPKGTKLSSLARQTCVVCGKQHYWDKRIWTMMGGLSDEVTGKGGFVSYCPQCEKQLFKQEEL